MSKFEIYERLFHNNTMEEYENFCLFNFHHHHHYKPFNCALIMAQRPGALFVQTERAWEKNGYALKPEAIPIVIMQVSGPVTLVYDREDVYSEDPKLCEVLQRFSVPMDKGKMIDDPSLRHWLNLLKKKGIRSSESHFGEFMHGKAEPLNKPITIYYTEFVNGVLKEKAVKAYHQITFNTNLNSHEKFLTLLHELGHLYCGHINGVSTKVNNIPSYRYGAEMNALEKMKSDLVELEKKIELTKGNTSDKSEFQKLTQQYEDLFNSSRKFLQDLENQKEYEAELVCKLLCKRNGIHNIGSDAYLQHHTVNGLLPDINIMYVMEAVEKIAGILNI